MPYPGLTWANQLDQMTRQELEQFVSLLFGWLSAQHKEDGSHAAITADSLAATGNIASSTGTGSFAGNVTAASAAQPVVIGSPLGSSGGNEGAVGTGIDINTGEATGFGPRIRILTRSGTFQEFVIGWTRGSTVFDRPLQVRDDTSLGGYAVMPGPATNVLKPCYLGSPTDAFSAGRWSGAYLQDCDALNGYKERGRTTRMGEWTAVAFAAGNFTANAGGSWTLQSGDQSRFSYMLIGKTLFVDFYLNTTTIVGAPTVISIAIPGGFTAVASGTVPQPIQILDNAVRVAGFAYTSGSSTTIDIFRSDVAAFTACVNLTDIRGRIALEVN